MKRIFTLLIGACAAIATNAQDMIITAAYDGPLSGGHPKGIELYVINNIADLSIYGVGSANNGQGTDGEEFTFPAVAATAGQFIYVAADSTGFRDFMGFDADYISTSMGINGDDAIELFTNGSVTDIFGDINVDGTGEPWEHLDGWAYRNNCTGPDGSTFVLASWSFSGINALDNETTNASAATPIPVGTYACTGNLTNVSFASSTYSQDEDNSTNDTVWINLSATAAYIDTVAVSLTDVTATYGTDYTTTPDLSSGHMFEVNPGDSTIMFIVNMIDDAVFEGDETFTVQIDSTTDSLAIGSPSSMTYTILENEVLNYASLNNTTASQLENVTADDTIWISLTYPSITTDTIFVSGTDVTATYGVDYTTTPDISSGAALPIAVGDSTAMIIVNMIDDATYEGDETFTIDITSVSDSINVGSNTSLTYTITEDDASTNPIINFANATETVTEGDAPIAIAMPFSPSAIQTDTIWVEVTNGTGAVYGAGNDYTIDSTVTNDTFMIFINNGDNATGFNFTVNDDASVESAETVTFTVVGVSGSLVIGSTNSTTVTINDNDVPTIPMYDIATVTTEDGNGDADSLNVTCQLTGIVYGENFRASGTGTSFTLIDATGGIACFDGGTTFGYTVTEGDSIVVEGDIGQYNGLTQLYLDTIIFVSAGHNLKAATSVTALDESTESDLVMFDSVAIVNPAQWTGTGSGFNVDVTDGTNTYTMRIDNDCDLYSMPVPGYSFSLTGIGGQFDNSAPYFDGYQILPRRATDLDSLGGHVVTPTVVSIDEIQTPAGGNDESPYMGQIVTTAGIVTAIKSGTGFWIQKSTGGPYSGVYVYDQGNNSPSEGDSVVITAAVDEFFGLTELKTVTDYTMVSSGNAFVITDLSTNDVNDEQYEGVMVKVSGATCTDDTTSNPYQEWLLNDGSGEVQVDNFMYTYGPTVNDIYNVTGPVGYSFSAYEILPRYEADVENTTGIEYGVNNNIKVFPNPVNEVLNIMLTSNDVTSIAIVDITGSELINLSNMKAINSVSVKDLNSGIYFIRVNTTNESYTTKFIKR